MTCSSISYSSSSRRNKQGSSISYSNSSTMGSSRRRTSSKSSSCKSRSSSLRGELQLGEVGQLLKQVGLLWAAATEDKAAPATATGRAAPVQQLQQQTGLFLVVA